MGSGIGQTGGTQSAQTVKLIVSLPEECVQSLTNIAKCNGITLGAALQQSISNEKFIGDELDDGGNFLVQIRSGQLRQIIFER